MRKKLVAAVLLLLFLSGCANENAILSDRGVPFAAEIEGERNETHFAATVTGTGNGEGSISYHSPDVLKGITLTVKGETVTLTREGMSATFRVAESTDELLFPLLLMTADVTVQKVQYLEGEQLCTFTSPRFSGEAQVTVKKDGTPRFYSAKGCAFRVTENVPEN